MEKIFKLKENGTNVKTEILAGLTTFMTMAYIIALNPNLLTGFDRGSQLWNGVFLATCIASAIAMSKKQESVLIAVQKFYNLFHISNAPSLQKSASKKKIHGFSRSFQLLCPPVKAAKNLI